MKQSDYAFPCASYVGPSASGMTLRQYYAAKAMQALVAEPVESRSSTARVILSESGKGRGDSEAMRFAIAAFEIADAMLAHEFKEQS